jgi:hypothetical protein
MEYKLDAYCGLYCGGCTVFLATKNNTYDKLAKEWNMEANDVICYGCKSKKVAKFCQSCVLKNCAEKKKHVDFCIECTDFPCQPLEGFKNDKQCPYHIEVYDNLKTIKEHGLAHWLKDMEKRWSCSQCGKAHDWFTPECPDCGNKLNTYVKPE